MGEAIVVLFVSDEQIYLQQIGSSNEICGLYLIIPKGENRLETLYRSYRCLVENGWWYTWHKILFKLFGCQDPETDPRWPQKREEFLNRHPEKRGGRQIRGDVSRTAYDVLIVSGVNEKNAPQCLRYRVLHLVEQLTAAGFSVAWIPYEMCTQYSILDCRMVVFYRCPFTEGVGDAIRMAKGFNIRVYFDIDDLVFDRTFTDQIPSVAKLSRSEKAIYDNGVVRMAATMQLCNYGITTTERLKEEMEKTLPTVYINRNCASEEMLAISEDVRRKRKLADKRENIVIGYFSGSLTHNSDFEMILPALVRVLDDHPNVRLLLMGDLDLPPVLKRYKARIIRKKFADWRKLPEIIGSVDINLAPVEDTIFNEAKSENKWMEASLVEVCTVASRVGAFTKCIQDGVTGFLCSEDEWYDTLSKLVCDDQLRRETAKNAYLYCKEKYVTTHCNVGIRNFLNKTAAKHIGFVLPSCQISGGIMVALWHASFLQDRGWQVDLLANGVSSFTMQFHGREFPIYSRDDATFDNRMWYDVLVATMWTTVDYVRSYKNVGKRCYLVQNYETDFYHLTDVNRLLCEATYNLHDVQYLTISQWCYDWLSNHYGHMTLMATNGMQIESFSFKERDFRQERKIRILIEGDCAVDYKNVDESFAVADRLDRNKFEVWYMSYNAKPKKEYKYDRFLHRVPYEQVGRIYSECDILIKSSWLESFSYPPLEMMATGGFCVVVPNGGNQEYLVDGENCLLYPLGNIEEAVSAVERICNDSVLRTQLAHNGRKTAEQHDWNNLKPDILRLYEIND